MRNFFQDLFTKNITSNNNKTTNNNIIIKTDNIPLSKSKDDEHLSRLKSVYEITIETRNLEIGQLVQRNNFFMIFQGVLFACLIYSSNTVPYVQLILCLVGFYVAYSQTAVAAGAKYWQEFWEKKLADIEEILFSFYKKQDDNNDKKIAIEDNSTEFYQLFSTPQDKIYENVVSQLDKHIEANSFRDKVNIRLNQFFNNRPFIWLTWPKIIYSREIILNKPSVSKIPIRVGRFFMIAWGLLFISTLGYPNKFLETKKINEDILRGFPTHKEVAKQEIYFSADKAISSTSIPLNIEMKDLEKLSHNQPINIELTINGQKVEAKGVIK